MYAGKKVTSDGSVLIGRTADPAPFNGTMVQQICERGTVTAFNGVKPEEGKRISLTDVFELMRTRYEGVNCPDENGDTSVHVIGTTKQMSCHVLQMRSSSSRRFITRRFRRRCRPSSTGCIPTGLTAIVIPGSGAPA